jgi:RNA polymerase sigma-70 factor, ECF subfamily
MTTLPLRRLQDLITDDELSLERREFQRLYHQTWADLFRYAFVLVRHREDAEDVTSEAFRRALESWDAGGRPAGEPLPWLFLIARRIVIDRHRRRRLVGWLRLDLAPEPEDCGEDAMFRRSELWIWFEQLCRVLPDRQREALFLRFQFDLSDAEAGKVMGTSPGNVRTLVSRGLATLRGQPEVMDQ